MTPQRYRAILKKLNLSQVGAAKFLGVGARTSRRWASLDDPLDMPEATEMLLELMITLNLLPNELRRRLRKRPLDGLNNPSGNPQFQKP